MNRTTMALAMGSLALASMNASAATLTNFNGRLADVQALTGYNHLTNINGIGATQRSLAFGASRVGLGDPSSNSNGAFYQHAFVNLDQAPGSTTGVITASDYAMWDNMRPGGLHMDENGDPTGYSYDESAYGVGQLSWCQVNTCAAGGSTSHGWNNTSNHILFSLSRPSAVTITLSNAAAELSGSKHGPNEMEGTLGGDLIPGFTIYSGVSTTGVNDFNHTFRNNADPWTNISYLDHDANVANDHSITWNSESEGFGLLAPGYYSLWIGGNFANVANADGSHGKNYALSISAAPVPVPASFWLFGSALAGAGVIGRKRKSS